MFAFFYSKLTLVYIFISVTTKCNGVLSRNFLMPHGKFEWVEGVSDFFCMIVFFAFRYTDRKLVTDCTTGSLDFKLNNEFPGKCEKIYEK